MSRTYLLTTPAPRPPVRNPVLPKGQAPDNVALRLAPRFLGRNASVGTAMGQLCNDLRTYGCNVHPLRAGTTGGHNEVVSRRFKSA